MSGDSVIVSVIVDVIVSVTVSVIVSVTVGVTVSVSAYMPSAKNTNIIIKKPKYFFNSNTPNKSI
jgi:hypothetical protein